MEHCLEFKYRVALLFVALGLCHYQGRLLSGILGARDLSQTPLEEEKERVTIID